MIKPDRRLASLFECVVHCSDACLPLILGIAFLGLLATLVAFAQTTTISGSVYAPNGADPLPNVLVYITTGSVAPFVSGAQCPGVQCQTASNAVPVNATVATYTGASGSFTLAGVPENTTYTLVIQAGKWRRQFSQVVGTTLTTGLSLDFPSTHAQGDIPLMAVATGSADALECALRDVGVADSEFTDDNSGSGGRVHLYLGNHSAGAQINGSTPSESTLMSTSATLNTYDLVLFPCQGTSASESSANIDNLLSYTSAGGRVFATHYSKSWIDTGETIGSGPNAGATYSGVANWSAQSAPADGVATINTGFTNGARLAQWMKSIGQSYMGTLGQVSISTVRRDTTGVNDPTQSWLTLNSDSAIMQFSFNTPVGAAAANQYGRVFFNEYHVENTTNAGGLAFPAECGSAPHNPLPPASMSAQEKMLEYTLFDLTNFVTPIVAPTVSIAITTDPANSIFKEGDTTDTITVDATNTSSTNPLDASTVLNVALPAGLTATAMTDVSGGWICTAGTLSCTRTTPLAPNASDSVLLTVSVAGNAIGGSASTSVSVSATVGNPTFSSNVTAPLSITLQRHAAVTWATPAAIAGGTPLSSTQLNAVGNTTGSYVYSPPAGTVLAAGAQTLSVTFTPSDQVAYPGTATTTVTLIVNSPVAATVTWPAPTAIGPIPVATASNPQSITFTIATAGSIGSALVTTSGATGSDFTDAGTGTCSTNGSTFVYSAGATCTVNVIFTPTHPGQRSGAVLLKDGSGNLLATAYLKGIGTGPQLNFFPAPELTLAAPGSGISVALGIAIDGNGNIFTADFSNQAIYETTPQGVTTLAVDLSGTGGEPLSLAVDAAGNLYIADSANHQVLRARLTSGSLVPNPSPVASGLGEPQAVAVDSAGNVYVAEANDVLIETLQPNGTYLQSTLIAASDIVLGLAVNGVAGIAVDPSGNVYIADSNNNRVIEEVLSGGTYTPALVAGGLDSPYEVALDGLGNIYIANSGYSNPSNSHIYKETPTGGTFSQSIIQTSPASSSIRGVAVDGAGNIYLSDLNNDLILEENLAATPSLAFASTNVGAVSSDSPQSVTVENVGNAPLFFTASGVVAPTDFSQAVGSGSPTDCASSATVATGAACNLSIQFGPTVTGNPLSEFFVLSDNALNASPGTQSISVSGPATPAPLSLTPVSATLTPGVVGAPYGAVTFLGAGGTTPYTYAVTGSLPTGLTMSPGGVLSGTPTTAGGPYSFTVTVTDSTSTTAARTYSITINPAVASQLSPSALPPSIVSGNNLGTFTATIKDANGVTVATSSALVTVTITGPDGYAQTLTVTAGNGIATFNLSSLPLTKTGVYAVTTASSGLPTVTASVIVTAGSPAQMPVTGIPATIMAGSNLGTAVARIEDANGNVVTTSTAPVTTTITGPNHYSQAVTSAAVNGVATLNLTALPLNLPGAYTATTTSPGLPTTASPVSVTAGAAAYMVAGSIPSALITGGNLGSLAVSVEDAGGNIVSSSSAPVTVTITGPDGYSQTLTAPAVNGVATLDLSSFVLTTPGTYTVVLTSPELPTLSVTVIVSQAFTLAFTTGTSMAPTQSVSAGSPAVFPFTLAPSNTSFNGPITLSASGLPPGATYSFSPPVVTPGAGPVSSTLTVQTAKSSAALQHEGFSSGLGTGALALLLLPFAASRRLRSAAKQMPIVALTVALLSLGALCGLTGCAAGGLFGKAPQTYLITVTGTSGSLSRSTTVTLIIQ